MTHLLSPQGQLNKRQSQPKPSQLSLSNINIISPMKVLFIQISDIHWQESLQPSVSARFGQIGATLPAHFVAPIDAVVFLYGGDFVFSGREEQFEEIYTHLETAENSVRKAFGNNVQYYSIGVPGNHDCDLSGDQSAREGFLHSLSGSGVPKYKGTYSHVLLEPQNSFFDFLDVLCSESPKREAILKIAWILV